VVEVDLKYNNHNLVKVNRVDYICSKCKSRIYWSPTNYFYVIGCRITGNEMLTTCEEQIIKNIIE